MIKITKNTNEKLAQRLKKKVRARKKIYGTSERPRLSVFRSGRHIYAQIIDDSIGQTLASASSLVDGAPEKGKKKTEVATWVGSELAKMAKGKNISKVVFDRNGFKYHGRIKALADSARESGLTF